MKANNDCWAPFVFGLLQRIYSPSSHPWGGKGCWKLERRFNKNLFHIALNMRGALSSIKFGISLCFSNMPHHLEYNLDRRTKSCDSLKHKTFTNNFSPKQKVSGKYKRWDNICICSLEKKSKLRQIFRCELVMAFSFWIVLDFLGKQHFHLCSIIV